MNDHDVPYRYRDYRKEPLSVAELRELFEKLGIEPAAVLRRRDRAAKEAGLSGDETPEELISLMSQHPTLLQRPIGVAANRAVVGRPPERLLELVE